MKNTTSYTTEEIKNKWLPNAIKMYNWYTKQAAKGVSGAKKSAGMWAAAVKEYSAIVASN